MTLDYDPRLNDVELGEGARVTARVLIRGRGNRLVLAPGAVLAGFAPTTGAPGAPEGSPTLAIEGDGNLVVIGPGARVSMNIEARGDGNRVEIGGGCDLNGFAALRGAGQLTIGAGTTMVQGALQLHEPGELRIGADCMISSQVHVSISDMHPIHDRRTGRRINPAAPVLIGDRVWLGLRAIVLKGAVIGEGAVIGAGAVVAGLIPPHVVAAGAPARVVRRGVDWRREFGP